MDAITLKSGHVLELGAPEFKSAKRLLKVCARELKTVDINLEGLDLENLKKLKNADAGFLVKALLQIIGSDEVEACILECARKSLLNGSQVKPETFEPEDMREDYLPVAWEVMRVSLVPFFVGLSLPSLTPEKESSPSPG